MTSRLSPSVLAASRSRRCVPLSMVRWSTRLSSTSRPCARKSSSRDSAPSRKLCSWSAYCSRLAPSIPPRKGFSGASAVDDVPSSGEVDEAVCGEAKRRRASAVRGMPVLVEKSSARCAVACCQVGRKKFFSFSLICNDELAHLFLNSLKLFPEFGIVALELLHSSVFCRFNIGRQRSSMHEARTMSLSPALL
jgi:hypothetical protein